MIACTVTPASGWSLAASRTTPLTPGTFGRNCKSPRVTGVGNEPFWIALNNIGSKVKRETPPAPRKLATNSSPHGLKSRPSGPLSPLPTIWPLGKALPAASNRNRETLLPLTFATNSSPRALNAISCGLLSPPPVMTPFGTALPLASKTYRLIDSTPQHWATNSSPVAGCAMTPRGAVLPRPAVMMPFDMTLPAPSNLNRNTSFPNLCAMNNSPRLNVARTGPLKLGEVNVSLNVGVPPGSEKRETEPLPDVGAPRFTTCMSPVSLSATQHGRSKLGWVSVKARTGLVDGPVSS